MTPSEALLCGLLNMAGKLSPSVYERMVKEMPERVERWLRPPPPPLWGRIEEGGAHESAAVPGRTHL
jgi:hypothetical protein